MSDDVQNPLSRPTLQQDDVPEMSHDPGDPNQPVSPDGDTPAANPSGDTDKQNLEKDVVDIRDDGSESDLSEIDEAQFADFDPANVAIDDRPALAVDETNIALIGVHKRKRDEADHGASSKKKPREKKREKKKERKVVDHDYDDLSEVEPMTGKRERKRKGPVEKTTARSKKVVEREATPGDPEQEMTEQEREGDATHIYLMLTDVGRARDLDRRMDEALKNPNRRRRKADEEQLEKMADALIDSVRTRMTNAAHNDNEAQKQGKMPIEKLKLLPEVVALLNRPMIQNYLVDVDAGVIEAMRFFLEPLSDGTLPSYDVQREMFTALSKMNVPQDTLVQSKIGRLVLFYTKSKKVQVPVQRMAERLMGEWTRPMLKRSTNYRDRKQQTAEYNSSKIVLPPTNTLPLHLQPSPVVRINGRVSDRAHVDLTMPTYTIAPVNVGPIEKQYARRPGEMEGKIFRKLEAKTAQPKRTGGLKRSGHEY
ncbi:MAG: hypothetical protein M1823_002897 [Watsoniomyces obsoletus]|nr:MAG: hypothetical protein M1823_002897 [Watsoniomyces obsoletus]